VVLGAVVEAGGGVVGLAGAGAVVDEPLAPVFVLPVWVALSLQAARPRTATTGMSMRIRIGHLLGCGCPVNDPTGAKVHRKILPHGTYAAELTPFSGGTNGREAQGSAGGQSLLVFLR
jgi:hypothetical protein